MDSLLKRVLFLKDATKRIEREDIEVIQTRAEDLGRNTHHREKYDVVMARAVAPLNVIVEFLSAAFDGWSVLLLH